MESISFLIADDEQFVTVALSTLIKKAFPDHPIHVCHNGSDAWNLIQSVHPRIVLSDVSMPGLDGFQLLEKVRNHPQLNDIYFIIITANVDKDSKLQALEHGADDYITKPFSSEELLARIRSASRYVQLQMKLIEENKLLNELAKALEQDIKDMAMLAVKFLQARLPASADMLKEVAKASVWIAKQIGGFDREQLQDIEIAAYLSQSGKVFLPDELVKSPVMIAGRPTNKIMFNVPVSARDIVSSVARFADVGKILYHVYENFDGSGFPDRLQSWQIPMSSRIIRVALDFEEIKQRTLKKTDDEILAMISSEANRLYDKRIVILLEQFFATIESKGEGSKEKAIQIYELEAGMVLSRDLITNSGIKLIPSGMVLKEDTIKKIFSHHTNDPIVGCIFIKK
ncbi:MAG: response regulator [Ignavibacteria bacterium]|jgi:response regulator RpfG family c-di-GMP phosphodiesterase|nr:response regulator [Ignavibacteria bacterium]